MTSRTRTRLIFAFLLFFLDSTALWAGDAEDPRRETSPPQARSIILMVADGLGMANVTAARIHKNGPDGPPLFLELPHVGYQRTYGADGIVTDSAAAASAWACGEKFNHGEVCLHADSKEPPKSILELAGMKGKATGLVATSTITHATPAAFASHVASRKCETEIARQYLRITRPDVLLGGGWSRFAPAQPDPCGASGDLLAEARARGYSVVHTESDLRGAVERGASRILGLFAGEAMTPENRRTAESFEPPLWEMTASALKTLGRNPRGFFLLVEGSQIDHANHRKDLPYLLGEVLGFDRAVKTVLDWLEEQPSRKDSTLLVVVSDHETGGFAIHGPRKGLTAKGGSIEPGWSFTGGDTSQKVGHTGVDTPVWSLGPGSSLLNRPAMENTEIYRVMKSVLD
ncbi:MAG TPA: alkaline phosphatase [Syntrophobacteraceae bacterium]|nr:alkaline phosphatase [Syntrophobacteraceae bacterium]